MLESRKLLKHKFRNRERIFAAWVSYSHSSITETFSNSEFDCVFIDMEHSTISIDQAQKIMLSSQYFNKPCIPRPVSHNNDYIKPLLESGADGLLIQMVETHDQVKSILDNTKYPPIGKRTYGVNRAQEYGASFNEYIESWNDSSIVLLQIESISAVNNIDAILDSPFIDGVMIGPMDISGSLGVPGDVDHPKVIEASKKVIEACEKRGISCGTQLASVNESKITELFNLGYTYLILGSDLFVLTEWTRKMNNLIVSIR